MNPLEKYKPLFAEDIKKVDKKILSLSEGRPSLIGTLVTHLINSGGKRLRPILLILSAKLCGNKTAKHIDLAACVELLHTATLFHDDVVDGSKLRRGRKTANELYGNSASVLVGDFLLAASFGIMADLGNMEVIKILSSTSSIITQGEVKQLMNKTNIEVIEADYIDIITAKTAALFASTCRVGAVIAKKSSTIKNNLESFGLNLGIAFQIADDTLDYVAKNESLGKKNGDDFREGKVTLPIILTYQRANKEEKKYLEKLFEQEEKARNEKELASVIKLMEKYNAIDDSIKTAKKYSEKAKKSISKMPENKFKEAMIDILEFSVDRKF